MTELCYPQPHVREGACEAAGHVSSTRLAAAEAALAEMRRTLGEMRRTLGEMRRTLGEMAYCVGEAMEERGVRTWGDGDDFLVGLSDTIRAALASSQQAVPVRATDFQYPDSDRRNAARGQTYYSNVRAPEGEG